MPCWIVFIFGFAAASVLAGAAYFCLCRADCSRKGELEELGKLTGRLAHELKNPLSIIKVNLKLISETLDGKDDAAKRASAKIATVRKEAERLERILENFLVYIKKTEPHFTQADINKIVSETVDFFLPDAQGNSIVLRNQLSKEPLVCRVDGDMLKQVLLNLFINARQAMVGGGQIMVRTLANGTNAVIIVSDTGRGIEPKNIDKIFDAYFSTKPGGSGLGLSTSKKIIDAHNGSIRVDSVIGKGTSFTMQLPLER